MIETRDSYLYVLVFPQKNVIKIGKANSVLTRCTSLKWIGKPDFQRSHQIKLPENRVFEIERALHLLLKDSHLNIGSGSGGSEIFDIDCLPTALDYLKVFIGKSTLTAGIKIPKRTANKISHIDASLIEKASKSQFSNELKQTNKLIRRLSKIVRLLAANHKAIPYQIITEPNRAIIFESGHWPLVERAIKLCQPETPSTGLHICLSGLRMNILTSTTVTKPGVARLDIYPERKMLSQERSDYVYKPLEKIWHEICESPRLSPALENGLIS